MLAAMDTLPISAVTNLVGWAAAGLTLATFFCRDMFRLRLLALAANAAFIGFGALAGILPVLVLHLALVPVNLRRLSEVLPSRVASQALLRPRRRPTTLPARWACEAAFAALLLFLPGTALSLPPAQRVHAQAVESFRQGRFSEAYGRFVQLANAGHAPSARVALWMCQQGQDLFGKDWDCTPDEAADWAGLAGVPVPRIVASSYPRQVLTSRGWTVEQGRASSATIARPSAGSRDVVAGSRPLPARADAGSSPDR